MNGKKNNALLLKVLILFFLISLTGCQPSETLPEPDLSDLENDLQEIEAILPEDEEMIEETMEEESENVDETEGEEISPNIILSLLFSAGDFIISPDGNLLYFTLPSAPGALYHVIDLTAVEIGAQTGSEIEWYAIAEVSTPDIMGNTYHLQITGDGNNLLYATSEILWDETEYGEKTVIYFSSPDFPPDINHFLELTGDEVPYPAVGSGIRPVWEPGKNNIYYLTLSGIYRYCLDERRKTLIRPSADLPGLTFEGRMAPHSFHLDGDNKELAYYNDGTIYLVSLVERAGKPETIKIDPGEKDIVNLEYLFNGSYIVLEDGRTSWGYGLDDLSLTFVDRQSREVVLEENDYLPTGYMLDDQGQMLFKSRGPDNEGYFVLLDSNLSEKSRISVKGIIPAENFSHYIDVIRLGGRWALPLYQGVETHFAEINFD